MKNASIFIPSTLGFCFCLLLPSQVAGEDSFPNYDDVLSSSFSQQQAIGGTGSNISFSSCMMTIELWNSLACSMGSTSGRLVRTIVDLREVREVELRSYHDMIHMGFDLDVPEPNSWVTLFQHKTLGRDEAFENFVERSQALLNETELVSRQEYESCDGSIRSEPKSRNQSLFLSEQPSAWIEFEELLSSCRDR